MQFCLMRISNKYNFNLDVCGTKVNVIDSMGKN